MRFSGVNGCPMRTRGASLVAQMLKILPAMQESWGSVPGDPPGGGNGNPLQYSCLENPMDRGLQSMGLKSQTRLSY